MTDGNNDGELSRYPSRLSNANVADQPQPIRTYVPAPSGRYPTDEFDGVTRFSRPRPHITDKQNWLICAFTHQGHLGCNTRS